MHCTKSIIYKCTVNISHLKWRCYSTLCLLLTQHHTHPLEDLNIIMNFKFVIKVEQVLHSEMLQSAINSRSQKYSIHSKDLLLQYNRPPLTHHLTQQLHLMQILFNKQPTLCTIHTEGGDWTLGQICVKQWAIPCTVYWISQYYIMPHLHESETNLISLPK